MPRTLVDNVERTASLVLEPLTVEQYHAMIERGILQEGLPIELIDGLLVRKDRRDKDGTVMTVGPRHGLVLGELADRLRDNLRAVAVHVREQLPITLSNTQEPEPDIAVVTGKRSDYPTSVDPPPRTVPRRHAIVESTGA